MDETKSSNTTCAPVKEQQEMASENIHQNLQQGDPLKRRSYSSSQMMGCEGEKKKHTPRAMFIELLEDCDRLSMFSDSGMSDISCTTDGSMNSVVDTGIHPGSLSPPSLGMRKNYSTNDVPSVKHQNAMSTKSQQKLPNIMLWNWLSHQKYGVSDNAHHTGVVSEKHDHGDNSNSLIAQVRSKYSFKMRDLNAWVPNEW